MYNLLLIILSNLVLSKSVVIFSQNNSNELKGVYIHTTSMMDVRNKVIHIYSRDSLFVYRTKVLEQIRKTNDTDFYGQVSREHLLTGYNLLDFANDTYASLINLNDTQGLEFKSTWSKKIGFDIHFEYYNGEQFKETKDSINGVNLKKITYISNSKQYNGCKYTIWLREVINPAEPSFMPNIESKFKGRVFRIQMETPDGREGLIRDLVFKPLNSNPGLKFLKSLKNK